MYLLNDPWKRYEERHRLERALRVVHYLAWCLLCMFIGVLAGMSLGGRP